MNKKSLEANWIENAFIGRPSEQKRSNPRLLLECLVQYLDEGAEELWQPVCQNTQVYTTSTTNKLLQSKTK